MISLFDLITKSGYEIQTIGNGALPCTLMKNGDPTAILMPDFSLRMVSGLEQTKPELDNMVQFSLDNQGMESLGDGFKLSQYKNVYLTTTYDFENHRPLFNVYRQNGESMDLLFSSAEQEQATAAYAQQSGLVQGNVLKEHQQSKESRIQNFLRQLQTHGFHVQRSQEKEHRYEITDKDGKSVGFIGSDNRAVITSDDAHVRQRLSGLYQKAAAPEVAAEPQRLSRWRQLLQNIGYSVRTFFSRTGEQIDIQDAQHHAVASIGENQDIHFTEQATTGDRQHLSQVQEQFRSAFQTEVQRSAETQQVEQPTVQQVVQQSEQTVERVQENQQDITAEREVEETQEARQIQQTTVEEPVAEISAADAVVLTAAEAQTLAAMLYENRDVLENLDTGLVEKLSQQEAAQSQESKLPEKQQSAPQQLTPQQPVQTVVQPQARQLTAQEQQIQADFQKAYTLLQTMTGFESPQSASLTQSMIENYGTASPQEFQQKLVHGDYAKQPSLDQQLHSAKREAQQVNNSRNQPQQVQSQERGV